MALTQYAVNNTGSDKAENTLTVITPPPALPDKIKAAELNFYGDSSAQFNGFDNADLIWDAGITTAERNTILSVIGVSDTVASNPCTFMLKQNNDSWLRVNATAVYSQSDQRRPYGRANLVITLLRIEAAS